MAGALRKTMVYLGLAEEDERYDAYDEYDDDDHGRAPETAERSAAVTPLPQRTPVRATTDPQELLRFLEERIEEVKVRRRK